MQQCLPMQTGLHIQFTQCTLKRKWHIFKTLLSYTPFSLDINMYILLKVLHLTLIVLREFVQISRNFLRVLIISFILFTCTFDLAMILFGDI